MSLIEKIDAEIKKQYDSSKNFQELISSAGIIRGLEIAKEIVLSEQKEPCRFCKDIKGIKYQKMAGNLLDGTTITIVGDTKCDYCPICGRPLNQSVTDNNVVTIGDKIRESNESLAEFIEQNMDEDRCDWKPVGCYHCIYYGTHHADESYIGTEHEHLYECGDCEFKDGILNYLNQPYTE